MRNILPLLLLAVFALPAKAQTIDPATCSDSEFRKLMWDIVSEGNRHYEKSNCAGIAQAANKLSDIHTKRLNAGRIQFNDRVEAYVDWSKLAGDWNYEYSNYVDGAERDNAYTQALNYYEEALATIVENPAVYRGRLDGSAMMHRELAQLYYKMRQYDKALTHTQLAIEAFDDAEELGMLDDADDSVHVVLKTQLALCNARTGHSAEALQLIDGVQKRFKKGTDANYEVLRKRAKILMLGGGSKNEREALGLYRTYLSYQKGAVVNTLLDMSTTEREEYWMRMRPFVADCYQLESVDPTFLYDVTLFAKGLLLQLGRFKGESGKKALSSMQYDWKKIQKRLPAKGCAIEFVQYEKGDEQKMAALVLTKTGAPQWVEMLSPAALLGHEIDGISVEKLLASTTGNVKNALYQDSLLASKIWNDRLVKAIGSAERVYFAPDGYLHQLAIEYMPTEQMADMDLYRLTSTRRLLEDGTMDVSSALIVGGVRYDKSEQGAESTANDAAAYNYIRSLGATFGYLPGSKIEGDSIAIVRNSSNDKVLTGIEATEQAFRQYCKDYPIISISTHGYFGAPYTSQGTDLKPCINDETLSRSIIAMAGVNANLTNYNFNAENADGILSAREISAMDLSATQLAVISACQTGLGYITADGVYGIQRGLKNAGVGAMLVSLWSVDDQATCLLMIQFHKNLQAGMPPHKALVEARRHLMQTETVVKNQRNYGAARYATPKTELKYNKPQYSNAFILIDAID